MATIEIELNTDKEVNLYVFDLSGRLILIQVERFSKGTNKIEMDMSGLTPGMYVIKAESGNDIRSEKFIVK